MTLNGVMTIILLFSPNVVALGADYVKVVATECSPNNLVFSDISFMAVFTEVTENECIIDRHLRDIHPLLDYDASERQFMLSI